VPRARPTRAALRCLCAAVLTAAATAVPAHAAITTNLSRSTVATDVAGPIQLERNGIVIGSAGGPSPVTCWTRFTPEILPGDVVRVGPAAMTVADVTVNEPSLGSTDPLTGATPFTIGGTAPAGDLTVELLDAGAAVASLAGPFTASGTVAPRPTDPSSRATFNAADGTTVAESATNRCSNFSANAVTVVDQTHIVRGGPQLNIANTGSDLTLQGPGSGPGLTATLGSLSKPATVTNNTWRATFTAADLATLPDGPIAAGVTNGSGLTVTKDTVGPGPPVSTPPPGRYINAPSVTLSSSESNAVVHYTTDGSAPTMASPVYQTPIQVTTSQTIRAFAVDAADNPGPVVTLPYQLATSGGTPGLPGTTPQTKPSGTTPSAIKARIGAISFTKRTSLRRLRSKGMTVTLELAQGTTAVRFTMYRRVKVKRHTRLKLVASLVRVPGRSGLYRAKLNARSIGLTTPGLYQLKIVPGLSRSTLEQSAARTVWLRVVR
jgi:hypothetical protein